MARIELIYLTPPPGGGRDVLTDVSVDLVTAIPTVLEAARAIARQYPDAHVDQITDHQIKGFYIADAAHRTLATLTIVA
jgi:hypothetical protein